MDTSKDRRTSVEWDIEYRRTSTSLATRETESDRRKSLTTDAEERRKSLARGVVIGGTTELRELLEDRNGAVTQAFAAYLRQELSHENIEFWWACEDYKNRGDHGSLLAKVALTCLCDEFVREGAPKQVNLDNKVRLATLEATHSNPGPDALLQAQSAAFTLMLKDTYPRFIKSFSSLPGSPAPASPEQQTRNRWSNNPIYGENSFSLAAGNNDNVSHYSEHEPGQRKKSLSMTDLDRYESLGILTQKRKSISQPGLFGDEDTSETEIKRGHSITANLKGLLHPQGKKTQADDIIQTNNTTPPHSPTSARSPTVVPRARLSSANSALGAHNRGSLLSNRTSMRNSLLLDGDVDSISEHEESLTFAKTTSLPTASGTSHTNIPTSPSPLSISTTTLSDSSETVTPRMKFSGGTLTKKMIRRKTFDFSTEISSGDGLAADDPLASVPISPHTGSLSKAKEIASYCSATLKRRMSRADFGGETVPDVSQKSGADAPGSAPLSPLVQTLGKAKEWSSTLKRRISRADFLSNSDGESDNMTPIQTEARSSTSSSLSSGSQNEHGRVDGRSPTIPSGREAATVMEVPLSPHLHTMSKAKEWSATLKRRISRADFFVGPRGT
eukprot:comp11792_c0_seq1/m.6399 comp11792_c0_seq1/g.6399  ORF comp11792_c0_seq1/g.6399 comp11792_c0_seq1/m.6399 type:complete len:615 (-) comp11792_c0_seq1:366-2210(-)